MSSKSKSCLNQDNEPSKSKAMKMFDDLFSEERRPLQATNNYQRKFKTNADASVDTSVVVKQKKPKRNAAKKVQFDSDQSNLSESTIVVKKKKSRKGKAVSMKDALLKAFENAGLPDYDEIAKHELLVSRETPGKSLYPKPPTPTIEECLKVFDSSPATSSTPINSFRNVNVSRRITRNQSHRLTSVMFSPAMYDPHEDSNSLVYEEESVQKQATKNRVVVSPSIPITIDKEFAKRRVPVLTASTPVADKCNRSTRAAFTIRGDFSLISPPQEEPIVETTITSLDEPTVRPLEESVSNSTAKSVFKKPTGLVPRLAAQKSIAKNLEETETSVRSRLPSITGTAEDTALRPSGFHSAASHYFGRPSNSYSSFVSTIGPSFRRLNQSTVGFRSRNIIANNSHNGSALTKTIQLHELSQLSNPPATRASHIKTLLDGSFVTAFTDSKVVCENGIEEFLTNQEKVVALCEPDKVTTFSSVFTAQVNKTLKKIGEGSYGEIFTSQTADNSTVVLKLVPCPLEVSTEDAFAQILPELMIGKTFSALREGETNRTPNFINLLRAACVKGKFPNYLDAAWHKYDDERKSQNVNPEHYDSDHLHVVMVLSNGGSDLESYEFKSAVEAKSIFLQVALSMAAAECEFQFEHRDLHWGNILIRGGKDEELEYAVDGIHTTIQSKGVFASVIDFTLSRMSKDGITVYDDLAKYEDLFEGKGDYQFDMYRMMQEENGNDWESFHPKTHVIWFDYLLLKLTTCKKFTNRPSPAHRTAISQLRKLRETILSFASAQHFVESPTFKNLLEE